MLPKRVVFATIASPDSGAGHLMRLIGLAKSMPNSIEKIFLGSATIPWIEKLAQRTFVSANLSDPRTLYDKSSLVILDSYDFEFCSFIGSIFPHSRIIQVVDRYTRILPDSQLIVMDLPFVYETQAVNNRILAHGIEYLPKRKFLSTNREFSEMAKKVLITTGATADELVYSQLLEELTLDAYKDIEFNFIGKYMPPLLANTNIRFHDSGSGFESIAAACDTAISASGTTMWDLFANTLVVGLAAIVENQLANFLFATESNQALAIFNPKSKKLIRDNLGLLFFDQDLRRKLYRNVSGKYDFLGADRVNALIFGINRAG